MHPKTLLLAGLLAIISYQADASCNIGQSKVIVTLIPDSYPNETTWSLRDANTNLLIDSGDIATDSVCVDSARCLKFTIYDAFGDGMCCSYGNGSYTVSLNGLVVGTGGDFNYSESFFFNCPQGYDCAHPLIAIKDTMTAPFPDSWYTFQVDSTGQYEISTCGLGNICDPKIYIYDHCAGLIYGENNVGTTYYNDDGCGTGFQSKIIASLPAGVLHYIRIGDYDTSCSGHVINWQIRYIGAIHGCTDPASCNYNPLATVSDSSCIYPPSPLCLSPDLTVDAGEIESSMYMDVLTASQSNCYISEGCLSGYGSRSLIRFTTHIRNIGNEDYYIGHPDTIGNQFVLDACHGHWHYKGYAEYLVYDKNNQPLQQGFKNGFCVMDLECTGGGFAKYGCGNMGISAGCGDIYSAGLDCQWIDVTDIDTGNYTLVVRVNWDHSPDRLGRVERTYNNNWAQVCFQLYYDSSSNKIFTILPDCVPYVDCAGDTFGNASRDCMGVCNGSGVRGDLNMNLTANDTDVTLYLTGLSAETLDYSPCNDLNGDSSITITDAVRLNGCLLSDSGLHAHPGNYQNTHKHCEFPFNIFNPFDTVLFGIADTNLVDHYIDLSVYNPTCRLLAYEFKLRGLIVDSIKNLAIGNYSPSLIASPSGHIVGIAKDEVSLFKQLAPLNFMRVYFSTLTDTIICISDVIAVLNSNYEEVTGVGDECVYIAQSQDTVINHVIPIPTIKLQVIPNPSNGVFEIYLKDKSLLGAFFKVLNPLGETCYYKQSDELSNHYVLDLSPNPPGIYLLQFVLNGQTVTRRLVLAK